MKLQKMRERMTAVVAIMGATFLPVAHASDWDAVVAFYPFDDQSAGANAAGATVENMIDSSVGPGTVSNGTGTGATATFDSEGPGVYVYSSSAATVPAYTNPASLHLTADSSVRGGAGKVVFTGLGNELSVRPNAHTIEYFFQDGRFFLRAVGFADNSLWRIRLQWRRAAVQDIHAYGRWCQLRLW